MSKTKGIAITGAGQDKVLVVNSGSTLSLAAGSVLDISLFMNSSMANLALSGTLDVVGNSHISTGTLQVAGNLKCGTHNAEKFSVTATTGSVTLNSITIDTGTAADVMMLGAKVGVCNDNDPSAIPAGGCVIYFDGTDLMVKNAAGKTSVLSGAQVGSWSA